VGARGRREGRGISGVARKDILWYLNAMTKLEEIEAAVAQLSPEELKKFRAWLDELDERLFDEKIERDAKAGKLDAIEAKALENLKAGRVKDL